jgi:hypothetical protein
MLVPQEHKTQEKQVNSRNVQKKHNPDEFEKSINQFKIKPYPEPKGPFAQEVILGGSVPDYSSKKIQKKTNEEEEPLQGKRIMQFQNLDGIKPNNTGLPDNLKTGIENLSGYNMDDVKVHYNSNRPSQLQAHAFAQGSDIHVAPGQEKHLSHEAWHVAQQKQGRVQTTLQLADGLNINNSAQLENEADTMGSKALQMKTIENKDIGTKQTNPLMQTGVVQCEWDEETHPAPEGETARKEAEDSATALITPLYPLVKTWPNMPDVFALEKPKWGPGMSPNPKVIGVNGMANNRHPRKYADTIFTRFLETISIEQKKAVQQYVKTDHVDQWKLALDNTMSEKNKENGDEYRNQIKTKINQEKDAAKIQIKNAIQPQMYLRTRKINNLNFDTHWTIKDDVRDRGANLYVPDCSPDNIITQVLSGGAHYTLNPHTSAETGEAETEKPRIYTSQIADVFVQHGSLHFRENGSDQIALADFKQIHQDNKAAAKQRIELAVLTEKAQNKLKSNA